MPEAGLAQKEFERAKKFPAPPIQKVELPEPEVSEQQISEFSEIFQSNMKVFNEAFEAKYKLPEEKTKALDLFRAMSKAGQIQTIMNVGDQLRIDKFKKEDPSFTPVSSFVQGVDDIVTLGAGTKIAENFLKTTDRNRLLAKAYSKSKFSGQIAGFFVPLFGQVGAGAKVGKGAARSSAVLRTGADIFFAGQKARPLLAKYADKVLAGGGFGRSFVGKALKSEGRVAKGLDVGFGASAFGAAQETVDVVNDVLKGEDANVSRIASRAATDFVGGAVFGLGFEIFGAAAHSVRGISKAKGVDKAIGVTTGIVVGGGIGGAIGGPGGALAGAAGGGLIGGMKGASIVGGKAVKYQLEHVEAVRAAIKASPESFIGTAAKNLGANAKKLEAEFVKVQEVAKKEIVDAVNAQKGKLKSALREQEILLGEAISGGKRGARNKLSDSSDDFFKAVEDLRKSSGQDVADASTRVMDAFRGSYKKMNEAYRNDLASASTRARERLKGQDPRIETDKVVDFIEKTLKNEKAFENGVPLPGSQWAADRPALFADLVARWEALGGLTKSRGGTPGTMAVEDAINMKKAAGELGHFAPGPTAEQAIYNQIYGQFKGQIEKVFPEVIPINKAYAGKRGSVDLFRERIGKKEKNVASFLTKQYKLGTSELEMTGFKALGEATPEGALQAGNALSLTDQLTALSKFPKGEEQARALVLKAFVNGDQVMIRKLDNLARLTPKLRPKIDVLERQAEAVRSFQDAQAASRAIKDQVFEGRLLQARPDLKPLIDEARAIQERIEGLPTSQLFSNTEVQSVVTKALPSTEKAFADLAAARAEQQSLRQTIPEAPSALEAKLGSGKFGPADQEVLKGPISKVPGTAEALSQAETGRVAKSLLTGEGATKERFIEQLPVIGDALFGLRKAATPLVSKVIDKLVEGSAPTRNGLFASVIENLSGTKAVSLEALGKNVRAIGAETALLVYIQTQEGQEDFEKALETLSRDLF